MKPELGYLVDLSPEGERAFIKEQEKCDELMKTVSKHGMESGLSKEELEFYEDCLDEKGDYWEILGIGCSWYCGGGQDTLSASSELKPTNGISYSAKNIHDLNYKTAWVEGVPGYGIGESITYHIRPQNPRITEIIIVNGYVKSEKTWRENSRVKTLKMYIDDKEYAILKLEDTRQEQHFKVEPLGYSDREDWDVLEAKPWWTMKFEVMEVYEGEKYDDTAITQIYFDGIDVH